VPEGLTRAARYALAAAAAVGAVACGSADATKEVTAKAEQASDPRLGDAPQPMYGPVFNEPKPPPLPQPMYGAVYCGSVDLQETKEQAETVALSHEKDVRTCAWSSPPADGRRKVAAQINESGRTYPPPPPATVFLATADAQGPHFYQGTSSGRWGERPVFHADLARSERVKGFAVVGRTVTEVRCDEDDQRSEDGRENATLHCLIDLEPLAPTACNICSVPGGVAPPPGVTYGGGVACTGICGGRCSTNLYVDGKYQHTLYGSCGDVPPP